MTSQIGCLKLPISRSILSGPLDFEIKRVACIHMKLQVVLVDQLNLEIITQLAITTGYILKN